MIRVTASIAISEDELEFAFVRAAGPGGQHVNKTATAAQLRFAAGVSPNLPPSVRARLLRLACSRATAAGEIIIECGRSRSQADNRAEALNRLLELIRRAATPPKPRRKTKPTAAARERRLQTKQHRGQAKTRRRPPSSED